MAFLLEVKEVKSRVQFTFVLLFTKNPKMSYHIIISQQSTVTEKTATLRLADKSCVVQDFAFSGVPCHLINKPLLKRFCM